jgi:hypothetical protein
MSGTQSISLLRLTDEEGEQMVFACVPKGSTSLVCMGEEDSWTETCKPVTSVIVDVSGVLQITNSQDLAALSAWLGAASVWLKTIQIEEEADDERDAG